METGDHEIQVSGTIAYSGKIVQLEVDEVRLPDGKHSVREVVRTGDSVAIAGITADRKLLMVRQYRYAGRRSVLEIPAGRIDDGETPEQAVVRELAEETGYRALNLRKIAGFYLAVGFATEFMHLFMAAVEPGVKLQQDPDEFISVELIPLNAITHMIERQEINDVKTLAAAAYIAWQEGLVG